MALTLRWRESQRGADSQDAGDSGLKPRWRRKFELRGPRTGQLGWFHPEPWSAPAVVSLALLDDEGPV